MPPGSEVFARTVIALQPYTADVVFIGGWVHALYLAEANSGDRPVFTEDIDVTIPLQLLTNDRPALLDLVVEAGYKIQEIGQDSGVVEIFQRGDGQGIIELDLLTQSQDPREHVQIDGQPNLIVHGYPGQHILLDNARWLEVGANIHESLDPPIFIRVPTLEAYAFGKGLSSETRTNLSKQAKDLVYLLEIMRHPVLGQQARDGLKSLSERYPDEWGKWRSYLARVIDGDRVINEVVDQLIAATRIVASEEQAVASVRAVLRRLLGQTPSTPALGGA